MKEVGAVRAEPAPSTGLPGGRVCGGVATRRPDERGCRVSGAVPRNPLTHLDKSQATPVAIWAKRVGAPDASVHPHSGSTSPGKPRCVGWALPAPCMKLAPNFVPFLAAYLGPVANTGASPQPRSDPSIHVCSLGVPNRHRGVLQTAPGGILGALLYRSRRSLM